MKTLLLSSILLATFTYANELKSELAWVDKQVEAIKPPREGIHNAKLSALHTPFIFLKKNRIEDKDKDQKSIKQKTNFIPKSSAVASQDTKSTQEAPKKKLQVDAIINQSILVNGKWYKIDDKVDGYTIKSIGFSSATLERNKKELVLTTNSQNPNIKFINK